MQVASDGALVVFHDLDLARLTPLRGPVHRRTAAELREHGIPTLDDVVELTRGRVGVMAELKGAYRDRRHDPVGRTVSLLSEDDVLLSFGRRTLLEAHRRRPGIRLMQHVGYGVSMRAAAGYAWAVGVHDPRVTQRGIERARHLGLATAVYTVNDVERMRMLAALGVDGIFTDCPDRARAALCPR